MFRTYYSANGQAHLLRYCVDDFLVLGLRLSDPCRRIVAAKCPDPEWTVEAFVVLDGELDLALRLFLQKPEKKHSDLAYSENNTGTIADGDCAISSNAT